jgi:hypothetical protein
LTKTDDILLELNRTVAAYVKNVPAFQYKYKTYHLIDNYVAVPYMRCDECGNYPALEVSVIKSDDGKTLRLGNECIDSITKQSVSGWFGSFRRKRESVMANRKYIDQLSRVLDDYENNGPACQITEEDAEKLRNMLEQIYNGLKPNTTQEQLADSYMNIPVTA